MGYAPIWSVHMVVLNENVYLITKGHRGRLVGDSGYLRHYISKPYFVRRVKFN